MEVPNRYFPKEIEPPRSIPFLAATLWPLLAIGLSFFLGKETVQAISITFLFPACIATIILTSRRPRFRRIKYDATFLGLFILALDSAAGKQYQLPVVLFMTLMPIWLPLITIAFHRFLFRKASSGFFEDRRLRTTYKLTYHALSSIGSIILFILWFGVPSAATTIFAVLALFMFGTARFYSGEGLTHAPVLYLRAFSTEKTTKTFKNVISPAIASRRILLGLTRSKDRKSLIQKTLSLSPARLYIVPDSVWKNWIRHELSHAIGVIIDLTEPTANLNWELEQAEATLPAKHILRLQGNDPLISNYDSINTLFYNGERKTRSKTRKAIRGWLDKIEKDRDSLVESG